jgi:hypothetical protein
LLSCRGARIRGRLLRHGVLVGALCIGLLPFARPDWCGFEILRRLHGVSASAQRCCHSALTSSWRSATRPPCLHFIACSTENCSVHPSHRLGREAGVSPKRSRRLSRKSSTESTVQLRLSGMVVSHAPVSRDPSILWDSNLVAASRSYWSTVTSSAAFCLLKSRRDWLRAVHLTSGRP